MILAILKDVAPMGCQPGRMAHAVKVLASQA